MQGSFCGRDVRLSVLEIPYWWRCFTIIDWEKHKLESSGIPWVPDSVCKHWTLHQKEKTSPRKNVSKCVLDPFNFEFWNCFANNSIFVLSHWFKFTFFSWIWQFRKHAVNTVTSSIRSPELFAFLAVSSNLCFRLLLKVRKFLLLILVNGGQNALAVTFQVLSP